MNSSFSTSRMIAWTVWVITSVFYAYQYILRVMPNVMLEDIMQQFHINAATFGQFSGFYYLGYSLFHLPIGLMLDRFGPKKVMSGCILLTVAGLFPLLFAEYWVYPIAGRLLVGLGSSAAILGLFKVIRMTFSEKQFPRMLSLSVMIGLIGAIYGGGPLNFMRDSLGYERVIQLLGAAGILLAALTYWIIPNIEKTSQGSVIANVREVLRNRRVLLSCFCAGLMVGPLEGFADVWATVFLKQVFGFEAPVAASLPSSLFMGMCFGAPALNFIAEKLGNHLLTIVGAGIAMIASFVCLLIFPLSPTSTTVLFAFVGMCCAYQILAIYKVSTFVREQIAGLTTALANMLIMIFGYAFHTSIGSIISFMGGPTSSKALMYGISVIPLGLFLGTAGFTFLASQEKARAKKAPS